MLSKLKVIWTHSWTSALGWAKVWLGLGMAAASYVGHISNDPGVQAAMSKISVSAEIGLGLAVLGALVLISESHA